jgi:prepilin-type N-terminal cleavage/methylation domain-containing protein
MCRGAFSLIELLVVIAIIGVLASIAVPSYKNYTAKVSIQKAYNQLYQQVQNLTVTYTRKGSFPSTFLYNGTTINPNAWTSVTDTSGNLTAFGYSWYGSSVPGIVLQAAVANTSAIPGQGVTSGNNIGVAVREVNGSLKYACGVLNGGWTTPDPYNVPQMYMPINCACTSLQNFAQNGTGC